MCGILGAIGYVDEGLFRRSLDTLTHRGPDGFGVWADPTSNITLGHRRLSIIDTSEAGRQPMQLGDFVITYNGEIYNFVELREMLNAAGFTFRTESDTEVLLASYVHWGPDCVHHLNGMWALAVWNSKTRELFLSRDRFGKKPLFYSFQSDRFLFGSEMKALLPLMDEVRVSGDFRWLAENVFDYEQTDKCLIDGIHRFPAGSSATLSAQEAMNRRIEPIRYWTTTENLVDIPTSYEEQVERFREIFVDACRLRMRSDVPIGTALSGGIDSSAVACTMHHIGQSVADEAMASNWQKAFVATFPGSEFDEREYAESVIRHIGMQGVFLPIDPTAAIENLTEYLYLFEELYATSPIPMMETYRSVRAEGVKVTIDGHGADELICGYDGFLTALNDAFPNLGYSKQILKAFGDDSPSIWKVYKQLRQVHHGNRGLLRFIREWISGGRYEDLSRGRYGSLNRTLYECFHHSMLPTLLRNYDRYSMAAGVEIRMPFMDHRLVSFCFSLPWQSKIPRSSVYTKAIIRDAIGPWMPEKVRFRTSKIGFNTPIGEWMKGAWKEFVLDTVGSAAFSNCALLDSATVKDEVETAVYETVSVDQADRAWTSLLPFFWEQAFLKRAASVQPAENYPVFAPSPQPL